MVYLTGDIHGNPDKIINFCGGFNATEEDIIVILGDVGANFSENSRDVMVKKFLSRVKPIIFCIHGNHEIRPATIQTYELQDFHGGKVWVEKEYPHLLFARDGDIYELGGRKCIVLGGAYSVDKDYRLRRGYGWWADEQPSNEIKQYAAEQLATHKVDVVLSHTCPFKYIPREAFLSFIDQSSVDDSTEKWLDGIEDSIDYEDWYCGHWHIDKNIDKVHFLMNGFCAF